MAQSSDVVWTGRPWVGPALLSNTVAAAAAGVVCYFLEIALGLSRAVILQVPLILLTISAILLVWLASLTGRLLLRASHLYVLRASSFEVQIGIAGKRSLLVSPSGFSELEVDIGIAGRILGYGTIVLRTQGGQHLEMLDVRDPVSVSAKIREIMTTPLVRVVEGRQQSESRSAQAPAASTR